MTDKTDNRFYREAGEREAFEAAHGISAYVRKLEEDVRFQKSVIDAARQQQADLLERAEAAEARSVELEARIDANCAEPKPAVDALTSGAVAEIWPVPISMDQGHVLEHSVELRFEDEEDADLFFSMYSDAMGSAAAHPASGPKALTIEQYQMQMAGISTASFGYWKEGDEIHPDYDTPTLRDVARLYARYAELSASEPKPLTDEQIISLWNERYLIGPTWQEHVLTFARALLEAAK